MPDVRIPFVGIGSDKVRAMPVVVVDQEGNVLAGPQNYRLFTKGVSSPISGVRGGSYVWQVESTGVWPAGTTATLMQLGMDGETWRPVRNQANTADVALTANGFVPIAAGQGSSFRVDVSGTMPANFYSQIAGIS